MEYVKVMLIDLPVEIDGKTVACGDDTFVILINARLNQESQRRIYDREIQYVNERQLNKMLPLSALQALSEDLPESGQAC